MLKLFSFPPLDSEDSSIQSKRRYITILYPFVIISALYFLYVFNIEYRTPTVNKFILPPLILTIISPFLYAITKKFKFFAYTFFIASVTYVYILIYMVGGIHAPGLFWIVGTPIFAAVILDRTDAILSTFLVFGIMILFYYLDKNGIHFNLPIKLDMEAERLRNIITFSIFFVGLFIFYIRNEEHNTKIQQEQKNKIDNLLRIIIHDFATPLMIISNNANKLQKHITTYCIGAAEHARTNLELSTSIKQHSDNLKDMIDQVRSLKAIKDGKYHVETEIVALGQTINNAIQNCSYLSQIKDISIELERDGDYFIKANATILEKQILQNLLTNAIKFSHPTGKIKIQINGTSSHITIKIIDHGIGMPESIQKDLFNIYAQTSRRGTTGEVGTGYGMPIVYEFVTLFGGTITVDSVEAKDDPINHGTTISLIFPTITTHS